MSTAVWWIRRDLRLRDNQALQEALNSAELIIPLFIIDETLWASPNVGDKRIAFMLDGLRALDSALRERGSRLIVRRGEPVAVLQQLAGTHGVSRIIAEEDYTPYARKRDAAVAAALPTFQRVRGLTVRHPDDVEKKTGGPYTVFTPYSNSWKGLPLPHQRDIIREPDAIRTPADIDTMALPDSPRLPDDVPFRAGEAEAQRRLRAFLDGKIGAYDDRRDRVDLDGTSTLSPYLRWGMLSAREAAVSAIIAQSRASSTAARAGAATWLTELIWRDFYHMILYHFPHVRHGNFREAYDALRWENDAAAFAAWCDGRTGFPVVDAAMRQLNQSGWMHNRARMIVASFLTKDLLIDWRWGERYFMQQLIDGDVAANNGGWQWAAGTGTDAAPYFRIFNPTSQGEKHDPHGDYVRRWVPELANVPDKFIQAPHELNSAEQRRYNCVIGRDYPAPIVDHKQARLRTLDAYKAARAA